MPVNTHIQELIEQATQHLQGWDERRGNYKETYCDKYKLSDLIVLRCAEFIEQDQGSGKELADRLKEYFGVNYDLGNT